MKYHLQTSPIFSPGFLSWSSLLKGQLFSQKLYRNVIRIHHSFKRMDIFFIFTVDTFGLHEDSITILTAYKLNPIPSFKRVLS